MLPAVGDARPYATQCRDEGGDEDGSSSTKVVIERVCEPTPDESAGLGKSE